jgi:hypothetical protein
VAAVAYLDGTLVFPRWQEPEPILPDHETDWAAVGITRHRPLGPFAYVGHNIDPTSPDGTSTLLRHEELDLATFYGLDRAADAYAGNFHNGLMIGLNVWILRDVGMAFVEAQYGTHAPEQLKGNIWYNRVDKPLVLRRVIARRYPILNLTSAHGVINTDGPLVSAEGVVISDTGRSVPFTTENM